MSAAQIVCDHHADVFFTDGTALRLIRIGNADETGIVFRQRSGQLGFAPWANITFVDLAEEGPT